VRDAKAGRLARRAPPLAGVDELCADGRPELGAVSSDRLLVEPIDRKRGEALIDRSITDQLALGRRRGGLRTAGATSSQWKGNDQ
jgi:hypothetical protein